MPDKKPGDFQDHAGKQGVPPPKVSRWQKGQSGNPGGRPKGKSLLAEIREVMGETELLGKPNREGKTNRRLLAEAAIRHAQAGRSAYFKLILEYFYGKPVIRIESKTVDAGDSLLTAAEAEAALKAMEAAIREQRGETE